MAHPQTVWTTPAAWTELVRTHAPPRNRRRETRYTIPRGVFVPLRIVPETETEDAELRNLSQHGVALVSPRLAAPGTYISFYFSGARVYGQVRHCRLTRIGFILGARVTDVFNDDGEVGVSLSL